ncbi:hypothetical protein L2E82_19679 [Cichorium intybus]|uniref:Uncharacterized protein n=1 Tax=Cichorium intybus TaxID=13427 RepID=A0ACB9FDI2_CICIN|nr:hypothetical protein L2E82_19679 [Cichorium intybus]
MPGSVIIAYGDWCPPFSSIEGVKFKSDADDSENDDDDFQADENSDDDTFVDESGFNDRELRLEREHREVREVDAFSSINGKDVTEVDRNILKDDQNVEPIKKSVNFTKLHNRKSLSVKLKDIIRASGQRRRKVKNSHIGCTSSCDDSLTSGFSKSSAQTVSSSFDEIQKIIQLGCAIGYQIQGEEEAIGDLISGEGGNSNLK